MFNRWLAKDFNLLGSAREVLSILWSPVIMLVGAVLMLAPLTRAAVEEGALLDLPVGAGGGCGYLVGLRRDGPDAAKRYCPRAASYHLSPS